ncbi:DJ-1 family glyoxalase III [Polyangium jinanense]|uniref:DJ-1/PfpI family protein n=1 Tax=Polyangium jinanense TaxID=2829994 RepID=A0A9X3XBD5_9BACT|nr:DJ-1 family glyoxalase III [Polyangium jinanense]MDC3962374.1 DJ-1/PfpI family protein [Polyangium jinanense]MDC3985873.1 DJ-1/PfpI family protein [Polyangium jinanense]
MTTTPPRALVLLAEGAEEMEATISVDVLRRASVEVVLAGVDGASPVRCSRGVRIVPDVALAEVTGSFDVIVLPGGKGGAERLAASPAVGALLRAQAEAGRLVAAICAAPIALAAHGVFAGRRMTCHPSVREVVARHGKHETEPVVIDGSLVTSQGPGTTFLFALTLVEMLSGVTTRDEVRAPMMLIS